TGRLRSNHQEALLRAALDSAGIMLAPSWLIRDQVATGRLRVVLQEFEPEPTPIHILYPHARLLSAKVRALIDYLAGQWRKEDFGFGRTPTKRRGGR
ncbi:MAG: LysR substrate-binding domain-containing protein, partial [Dongiaceae bacterium]